MKKKESTPVQEMETFKTNIGFILASVGSAVGMGNIWMFPYRVGQLGGAAFLIPYFIFVALFSVVGLSAEFGIGRLVKTGTLGSYEYCFTSRKKGKLGLILGWIPLLGSLGIAIGYSVIVGWVLRSLFGSMSGAIFTDPDMFFAQGSSADFSSIPWHFVVVAVAVIILLIGVTKGIEKINKILMPTFFVLFVVLAIRVAFLPGAMAGYEYLLIPKWDALLNFDTWVLAMGQAFFSLSITGSGMIVYGTYLSKKSNIVKSSCQTGFFDTIAASLAALAIIPAVFAFGIEPNAGPPLMFITLPKVFAQMPAGEIFATIFFASVVFAGITSLINMLEAVAESLQNRFKMKRTVAVILTGAICFGAGLFIEAEPNLGAWMDFITIKIVPLGAVLGALSVYWVLGYDKIKVELEIGRTKPMNKWFGPVAKYIYVPLTIAVFVLGLIYNGIG